MTSSALSFFALSFGVMQAAQPLDQANLEDLIVLLHSGERNRAIEALARQAPRAVPVLVRALDESEGKECFEFSLVFERMGPAAAGAVPALIQCLKRGGRDDPFLGASRESAATALGAIGEAAKPAVPVLIDILKDDETLRLYGPPMVGAVEDALGRLGPVALPELLAHVGDAPVDRPLARIGKAAVPGLLEAMRSKDAQRTRGAIQVLGFMGPDAVSAMPALIEACRNPLNGDAAVRDDAIHSFVELGPIAKDAVPYLIPLLDDPKLASEVLSALGHIGPAAAAAIPTLAARYHAERRGLMRASLISTLGQIGAPATPILIEALLDPESEVRRNAVNSLTRIGRPSREALEPLKTLRGQLDALEDDLERRRFLGMEIDKAIEAVGGEPRAPEHP